MILVDTSSWIHLLRPNGDKTVRARVERALAEGQACWCPMVRLELWNGAAGDREKRVLRDFERVLPELAIDGEAWAAAFELARQARAVGLTVPASDLLIAACARHHSAGLETADTDFDGLGGLNTEAKGPQTKPSLSKTKT
jgi:predicted nucleic acid-binding protein